MNDTLFTGYQFGGVPYVRDLISGFASDYGYTLSPVEGLGKRSVYLYNALTKTAGGRPDWHRIAKESINVSGYLIGLPSGQMVITMDGILTGFFLRMIRSCSRTFWTPSTKNSSCIGNNSVRLSKPTVAQLMNRPGRWSTLTLSHKRKRSPTLKNCMPWSSKYPGRPLSANRHGRG
jgi:hypothetical protein